MPDPIHLSKLVNKAIQLHNLNVSEFAARVVRSSRHDVDKLLYNGSSSNKEKRGWIDLKEDERGWYNRMSVWLQKSIEGNSEYNNRATLKI